MDDFDTLIIGAGMSGIAAAIRLAMFDKKVAIIESHSISGGLNSYYQRGGREIDVGLHALTNFALATDRNRPLLKILKQLRIPYGDLQLAAQTFSSISFAQTKLSFGNNGSLLSESIGEQFPQQLQGWHRLCDYVDKFDELDLNAKYQSAKQVVSDFITCPKLLDMIFCPLFIYGSAWEHDMDISQFVIMFKALYREGFSRPRGGVRTIIELLLDKYHNLGGQIFFKQPVQEILRHNDRAYAVKLTSGKVIKAKEIISSIGMRETLKLAQHAPEQLPSMGRMSFCECLFFCKQLPRHYGIEEVINFYNDSDVYHYQRPDDYYDLRSAVMCFPNNYAECEYQEGVIRMTFIANYDLWQSLKTNDIAAYRKKKQELATKAKELVKRHYAITELEINFEDVFTPSSIERYTGHLQGAVYGGPNKFRNGVTPYKNLYICGTDQGFLGIVGALLSGISMANLHILAPANGQRSINEI